MMPCFISMPVPLRRAIAATIPTFTIHPCSWRLNRRPVAVANHCRAAWLGMRAPIPEMMLGRSRKAARSWAKTPPRRRVATVNPTSIAAVSAKPQYAAEGIAIPAIKQRMPVPHNLPTTLPINCAGVVPTTKSAIRPETQLCRAFGAVAIGLRIPFIACFGCRARLLC